MALTKLPKNAFGTGSVDDSKIEDGTIQNQELAGSLSEDRLATGTIENASLSNSTITINGSPVSLGGTINLGTAIIADVEWQSVITAAGGSSTATANEGYFIDTTSNTHTLNLPASASIGDTIAIKDYAGTFASNNLTIGRNGHNIQGVANDSIISTNRASLVLVYVDSTKGWLYTDEHNVADLGQPPEYISATGGTITTSGDFKIHSFTGDGCFVVSNAGLVTPAGGSDSVDYLVVAGGGGAGGDLGSGGGGGGFRISAVTVPCSATPLVAPGGLSLTATTYPITVGSGGAGNTAFYNGNNGSDSVFSTITSAGGGGGAGDQAPCSPFAPGTPKQGSNGGSGGGSQSPSYNASGNTPPVSPPQGNDGGTGSEGSAGGGGGGAATGSTSTVLYQGGDGGNGSPVTAIFGTAPQPFYGPTNGVYAGGGGGGGDPRQPSGTFGTGGPGGGGNGSLPPGSSGNAGTANTGGGGGGGSISGGDGASGGKGIVLIRYKFQ